MLKNHQKKKTSNKPKISFKKSKAYEFNNHNGNSTSRADGLLVQRLVVIINSLLVSGGKSDGTKWS